MNWRTPRPVATHPCQLVASRLLPQVALQSLLTAQTDVLFDSPQLHAGHAGEALLRQRFVGCGPRRFRGDPSCSDDAAARTTSRPAAPAPSATHRAAALAPRPRRSGRTSVGVARTGAAG
jgi:hypothetical protein